MAIFDILGKLTTIFKGDGAFSGNKIEINFFKLAKNESKPLEVHDNILQVDLGKLDEGKKEQVLQLLHENREADNTLLLGSDRERTESIKEGLPSSDDEVLIDFYRDKLPEEFIPALEASLVVRNLMKKGKDIKREKRDISRRYQQVGTNICNLVSRDYFHGHFKELYESMSREEGFDIQVYRSKLMKIVTSLPYTVFINQVYPLDRQIAFVKRKVGQLKGYGTGRLLIHALGRNNVATANKILAEFGDDDTIDYDIGSGSSATNITVILKF